MVMVKVAKQRQRLERQEFVTMMRNLERMVFRVCVCVVGELSGYVVPSFVMIFDNALFCFICMFVSVFDYAIISLC